LITPCFSPLSFAHYAIDTLRRCFRRFRRCFRQLFFDADDADDIACRYYAATPADALLDAVTPRRAICAIFATAITCLRPYYATRYDAYAQMPVPPV